MADVRQRSSDREYTVLTVLRAHSYNDCDKGNRPTDPGWHACICGWEGYWCDYQPHVAERVSKTLWP